MTTRSCTLTHSFSETEMLCKLTGDPGPVQNHQPTGAGHRVTVEALAPSIRLWTPDFGAKSGRERTANGGFGVG